MFQKLENPRVMFVTVAISVIKKLPMLIMFNFRHIERDLVKDCSMRLLFTRYIFIAAVSTYVVSKMHANTKVEISIPLVAVDCFQNVLVYHSAEYISFWDLGSLGPLWYL